MLTRKNLFESIKEKLEGLQVSIGNGTALNHNDLAVHAENFFRDLLNRVYGWKLENTNFDKQNTKDIDLADKGAKLAIQVTARNDQPKIKKTLDGFYSDDKNADVRLKFMFISREAVKYEPFKGHETRFKVAEDIIDIKKLLKKINDLSTEKMREVAEFLEKEIDAKSGKDNAASSTVSNEAHIEGFGNLNFQGLTGSTVNINLGKEGPDSNTEDQSSKTEGPISTVAEFYPAPFIPDLKYFVGREDLLANLGVTLNAHHKASIHDISGLGKTFACYKFADDNKEKYSRIFFVNAAKEAMMESLARLGQMLHPGIGDAPQEQQAMVFKNWLETNDSWLAIYDNVDEPASLKPFVPNNPKGDCLFTSNTDEVTELGRNVAIFKLPLDDSGKLLYKRVKGEDCEEAEFTDEKEKEAFKKIVDSTDGLPIALVTTGAFIKESKISFQEFWEVFENAEEIIITSEDKFDEYEKGSALKAFSITLDKISGVGNEEPSLEEKSVREMLNVASLVFPDGIPEEFLQSFLEKNLEGFDKNNKSHWIAIRNRFSNFDLFKYDTATKSFSTHRLIQKCVQSRLGDSKIVYCGKVLDLISDFFPVYDYNNKAECERYYQHTLTALENANNVGFETRVSKSLYFRIGSYQQDLGRYGHAMEFYQKNLEIARKVFGGENEGLALSLNNLALVYKIQGKYDEAINLYKEAIEIDENTIGKEDPGYATDLNNLAGVYMAQGKYDEAIELYTEAMEINGKALGKEHTDYATSLSNLGVAYDRKNRYDEAVELHKKATDITGKALGKKHPDYANRVNNLAVTYFKTGKYSEALPLFEESLRILEAKLPSEHPNIANVKRNIENCKRMLGWEGGQESS